MARHVRLAGLASLLVVDREREIDDLIDHPALERDFAPSGPLLNRVIVGGARRSISNDGHVLLSFRPREDEERQQSQRRLLEQLDALAAARPWAPEAITAMARYVATGDAHDAALAGLTYVTAYPFFEGGMAASPVPFNPAQCTRMYRLYRRLSKARRPLAGFLTRLLALDTRARRRLLQMMGGNEYGLHAVGITLDNSLIVLDQLRKLTKQRMADGTRGRLTLEWASVRTAPALVLRQIKEAFTLPHTQARVPANTLVLLRMRQSLALDTPSGYEFASTHWSACPARRYLMATFGAVCDEADSLVGKGGAS
jgi:hypothetical protein